MLLFKTDNMHKIYSTDNCSGGCSTASWDSSAQCAVGVISCWSWWAAVRQPASVGCRAAVRGGLACSDDTIFCTRTSFIE